MASILPWQVLRKGLDFRSGSCALNAAGARRSLRKEQAVTGPTLGGSSVVNEMSLFKLSLILPIHLASKSMRSFRQRIDADASSFRGSIQRFCLGHYVGNST